MQDILNANNFYIVVIKENGDLYEYGIDRYGNAADGRLVIQAVKSVVTKGSSITIIQESGRVFTGSTSRGISPVSGVSTDAYKGGFFIKDGSLMTNVSGELVKIADDVKLFDLVGDDGVFMIRGNNSIAIYTPYYNGVVRENYGARFYAVNFSPVTMGRNEYYEKDVSPIWEKTRELCGGETDLYKNAKTISDWIGTNIKAYSDYSGYGINAFNKGSGTPYAISDLTYIMFTEMEIPCYIAEGDRYAWNLAIIDGVVTFIDN